MRSPERINDVVIEFQKLWQEYPDMRFGQLIECIIVKARDNHTSIMGIENDLWNCDDDFWIKAIKEYKKL